MRKSPKCKALRTVKLTQEQLEFRAVLRDFATSEIAPHAEAWDRNHIFPTETVKAMGDLGLFGLIFAEEYGGSNTDFTTLCVAIEEIGRTDQSMGITLEAGVCLGATPIAEFGSSDQKDAYLPDLVSGRALAGFGLTEPDGGSDAGTTKTRAARDSSGTAPQWVIDGAKTFITNSGTDITSLVTVTALTDEGVSSIIVPTGTPGFIVEPPYRKMGWHASDTHGLVFDNCRVPESNLLGR
ncbi:MAG: acyl-CoA dehydrogenase, partial [Acidimicrobiaceae bacterium]|nr:acyl-CoA dehydrogenase [Acidimicrobiaceae bacterium]